jgi:CheY-like chemotaxis protein
MRSAAMKKKARAAGCDAYMVKPYSARKLLETINQYLTWIPARAYVVQRCIILPES